MEILDPPIQIVTTTTITHYTYQLYNWVLNKEVTLLIDLYCNQQQVKQIVRKIEGPEYQSWTNDTYIIELVKTEIERLRRLV